MAISYKDSGVDVTRGYKAVELMKNQLKSTYNNNVMGN
jgi:phosphoribosylaminoimidazole (AIR) synthetase